MKYDMKVKDKDEVKKKSKRSTRGERRNNMGNHEEKTLNNVK